MARGVWPQRAALVLAQLSLTYLWNGETSQLPPKFHSSRAFSATNAPSSKPESYLTSLTGL